MRSFRNSRNFPNDSGDEAKLLAGGHSMLPMMKLRFAQPAHLIDVKAKFKCPVASQI
jgi:CO/xanthine dehydrogenase FAD-binding subunit